MSFSVAIVDNHDVTRWGVRTVVENYGGQVVSTAETGLEAMSVAEESPPDLLILSLKLPHLNGLDVLLYLQRCRLAMKILVLTTCDDEERIQTVFDRGASACVLKQDPLDELGMAFDAIQGGDRYVSSSLPDRVLGNADSQGVAVPESDSPLTLRERQVMQLTAEGYTSQEVSDYLAISSRTVEKHRENIKSKLGMGSVVEMASYASERGFLFDPRLLHAHSKQTVPA